MRKIFTCVLFMNTLLLYAQNEISNLVKSAGTSKEYPGINTITVFDSTDVHVMESGLSHVRNHSLVKILTPAGAVTWSVIKSDYDPQSAFVRIEKIIVYYHDGKILNLDTSKVLDYPAPAGTIFWGAREKMIEAGRLEPGDAVEIFTFRKGFTYALLQDDDDRYIPPMRGQFYDIVPFWTNDAVNFKTYRITLPADKSFLYRFYNGTVLIDSTTSGSVKTYTFTKGNILPLRPEPGMVSISDVGPKLLVSTCPDWRAKSRWFYQVNEDYGSFTATPEVKAKVNEILRNARDEMDSVSLLTHWAGDEIRYLGLSMGKGEGYTLHNAKTIYTDRCGVCKDKASILVTMLRAAGFEAYAAMTMAGSRIEYIPADQFNHSVVAVRLKDGKFHMLDPTWVPFVRELWSSLEQQQNFLIGDKNGEDLGITPVSDPENHFYKVSGNTEINEYGVLSGELVIEAEGQSDASFRNSMTRNFRSTWYNNFESEILRDFPGMQIIELSFSDGYDYSKPFRMYVKFIMPDYGTTGKNLVLFTPVAATQLFPARNNYLRFNTGQENRKYPFRDACSKSVYISDTVKIPEGYEVVSLPQSVVYKGSAADYSGEFQTSGRFIIYNEHLVLKKRIYEPADWESFRTAINNRKAAANRKVIIKKISSKKTKF